MTPDEEQIRALIAGWMAATKAGDADKVLGMMTDDAVFLLPGRPPMRKPEFAAAAKAQAAGRAPAFDGHSPVTGYQARCTPGNWRIC